MVDKDSNVAVKPVELGPIAAWQAEWRRRFPGLRAVRDGNLITGQQNFSGAETARLVYSDLDLGTVVALSALLARLAGPRA